MIKLTQLINELKLTDDMRIHTSKKPFELEPRTFTQKLYQVKPNGFWYGFGSGWFDWSRVNLSSLGYKHGKYIYSVDIGNTNTLQIKTYEELVQFSQTYAYENHSQKFLKMKGFNHPINDLFRGGEFGLINWEKVVSKYDGIEINPHQDEAKNSDFYIWYHNWDIASGCVWNLSGVKLKLLTDQGIE